jgi:hypothetical protein
MAATIDKILGLVFDHQHVAGDVTIPGGGGILTTADLGDSVAPLSGAPAKIPNQYIPALAITETYVAADEPAHIALNATTQVGDVVIRSDESKSYIKATDANPGNLTDWIEIVGPYVLSVNGVSGPNVVLTTLANMDYIDFDTTAGDPGHAEGRIFYDPVSKALGFYNDIADSTAQIPYESWVRVYNPSAVDTISNGAAVRLGPADPTTGLPTALLAQADSIANSATLFGLATHDIPPESEGILVSRGRLNGYDTDTPPWASGEVLWLDAATPGALTNVRPAIPNRAIRVGVVGVIDPLTGSIEVRIESPETQSADDILFPVDHDHINNLEDVISHVWGPGACRGGFNFTEVTGEISLAAGSVVLRETDTQHGTLRGFYLEPGIDFPNPVETSPGVGLTDNATNYIIAEYNGGSPTIRATVDLQGDVLDREDTTLIYAVNKLGNDLNVVDVRGGNVNFFKKNSIKDYFTHGIEHASGALVADLGNMQFSVTEGKFWVLNNEYTTPALDTSVAGVFEYVYQNGVGGWTRIPASTDIDYLNYDLNGTLTPIGNNKFGVAFLYAVLNEPAHYKVVYGRGSYDTLSDAQAVGTPATLPSDLDALSTAVFIAKIITQQNNATSFVDIQSPFAEQLNSALANTHNSLAGLDVGDYQHLTALEHNTYSLGIVTGAHSFSTGDPVYNNAGVWTAAQANDRDTLTQGVVYVIDATNYVVIPHGKLTWTAHGKPVGEYLFLGETGGLTATEPQGMTLLSDPVGYVLDANTIIVLPYRPSDSIPRSNDLYGKTISFADSPYNVQDIDELLLVDTTGGPVDVILPVGADYDNFLVGIKKIAGANSVFAKTTTGLVEGVAGTTGREISVLYVGEKFWHNGTDYWIAP